jgi:hypothetical protein
MDRNNIDDASRHPPGGQGTGCSFDPRYLAAKKSIDDRALNHHVRETLRIALAATAGGQAVNIVEIGAGIGTMLSRIVDWGLLPGAATYLATDSDPGQVRAAHEYLSSWAAARGHDLSWSGDHAGRLTTATAGISLSLEQVRAEELAESPDSRGPVHLFLAHAVLDLIDFPVLLPKLLTGLTGNGLAYLTCNFDGETVFLPRHADDEEILRLYHHSMEERRAGASHTGRRLLGFLQGPDLDLLAAGSSDWLIHPRSRSYSKDETFFLHAIIDTVQRELAGRLVPASRLAGWSCLRHRQVDSGDLTFLARHLDFLARRRPGRSPILP